MSSFLETAFSIARRICRDAIWDGTRCNWVGPSMDSASRGAVSYEAFHPDLYSGTSGVALFLASLVPHAEDPVVRKTAEGAVAQAYSRVHTIPAQTQIGTYSGKLGVAWALIRVGELLRRSEWQEHGISLIDELAKTDAAGQEMDLIGGYAGAIPLLLQLSCRLRRTSWAKLAVKCGEELERAAIRSPEGWSWKTIEVPAPKVGRNLTGFSHGTSGIGWALLELGQQMRVPHFSHAAEEAFRYERAHYSAEHENWPDFRDYLRPLEISSNGPLFATAWCHGAPGISLARLQAWKLTKKPVYHEESEAGLRTTARTLKSGNTSNTSFCLCHGRAGNADVLLEAASALGIDGYREAAEAVGEQGMEQFDDQRLPWPCGIPGAGETKSLMLGTAGIGYFYLRLYDPETPTILMIGLGGHHT